MPRKSKGPRLYLRRDERCVAGWVIRDGSKEIRTGCSEGDYSGAQKKLGEYLTAKYEPPKTHGRLDKTIVADVMTVYLREHAPSRPDNGAWLGFMAAPIVDWWGAKSLGEVKAKACRNYATHRIEQGVSDQTARHELKQMAAALRYYHINHGPLASIPEVTLPPKRAQRTDYWLTRKQVADRLRLCRRSDKRWRHVARLILIGVYSGTRPGATKRMRWMPSTTGGWFDLESETFHRAPGRGRQSKKRQPPARIHRRLLPHLKRWKRLDEAKGITNVIHYAGREVKRVDTAWASIIALAGHSADGPHICRHTAATWQMQAGVDPYEVAGFLGMSVETLLDIYGHHHPDFQKQAASADRKRGKG